MTMEEYWIEAVSCALDDEGVSLTEANIKAIANSVQLAHENIGLAFGYVENPLIHEMAQEKDKHRREIKRVEDRENEWIKSIAHHHRVEPQQIHKTSIGYEIRPLGR